MARKNSTARQRNAKGRLNRREHGSARPVRDKSIPRLAVEDMIMPDGTCLRNSNRPKAKFDTPEKAQKALDQAQSQRARAGSGHVEKRFYHCWERASVDNQDGSARFVGCNGYHLTSRETYENAWKKA